MNTKNALLVVAGLMLAWAGAAFADMTMTWAGERQGVAKAAVAGDTESAEATDVVAEEEDEKEESSITREEYLATVAYVEGEAAVDELSRRMVEDMFGPSDDGVGSQYGDSTLPGGGDEGALPGGVKMTRGAAVASRSVPVDNFSAGDDAANYTVGADWLGGTGGTGFEDAWHLKSGSAIPASDGGHHIANSGNQEDSANNRFNLQSAGEPESTIVAMRDLQTTEGLVSGTFKVTGWGQGDEPGDFVGFAVYGANESELFRWGATINEEWDPSETFSYSTDGGRSYNVITATGYRPGGYDYTLTWALLGETMTFELRAADTGTEAYFIGSAEDGYPVSIETTDRVMAIAAVLTESGDHAEGGDGTEMRFDNIIVTGHDPGITPAVPEPGTLGLLAAGLAALLGRRAERRGQNGSGGRELGT